MVCIYDYELAKEICAKEEASGRPDIFWNNIRMLNKRLGNDVIISNFYVLDLNFESYVKALINHHHD